ncbi:hypothetical protein [Streptomyces sp. NBC_01431]|uniref:hypothetical protein n=1 Tax=Streptomyces sp. NBC_01431 TaxID=2903863 RepID=UPI002E34A5AD|nr:hypothetical protein [Streptomyces sp. NBC_01431]
MWIVAPLAVLGAVGAGYLTYRFVVDPLVANTADAIKLTLAILTLIGAVLAGVYAYRKQRIAESDTHRADAKGGRLALAESTNTPELPRPSRSED